MQHIRWFALLALLSSPGGAHAERLSAAYELTWTGLAIGTIETHLVTDEDRYRFGYTARTTGMLGWLFPFTSEGQSEGALAGPDPRPERYQVQSRWDDGSSDYAVTFDPAGGVIDVAVPAEDLAERDPVPAALQVAPDPLALALEGIARAAPGVTLAGTSFDGKRALSLEVACAQDPVAPQSTTLGAAQAAPGMTTGDAAALLCQVDGRLAAGASRRWREREQDQDGDRRDPGEREPTKVWLERADSTTRYWPVRVEADTRFGTVTARLIALEPVAADGAQP